MKYDFLIAGFPKCGTTTLHNLMQQNPRIYLPKCKETFYFSNDCLYGKKEDYLERHFYREASSGQIIGGVEPSFFKYAKRVEPYLHLETKIVFMIRNPIHYLFSFYHMCMFLGAEEWYKAHKRYESFSGMMKACIKNQGDHYSIRKNYPSIKDAIIGGKYIRYIKEFEKIAGRDNIKVILFEDFIKDEEQIVKDVFAFVGAENVQVNTHVGTNKSELRMPNCEMGRKLLEKRERIHHDYIEGRVETGNVIGTLYNLYCNYIPFIASVPVQEELDDSVRHLLHGYYNDSVLALAEFAGKDLLKKWEWSGNV